MKNETFPIGLLKKGKEEKIKYFEELTIAHPKLSAVFDEIWQSINFSKPGSVILVFGPTGVGKTTLLKYLEKRITEDLFEKLQANSSIIPFVSVEASMPTIGNFDWKELFRDMLEILNEPAVSSMHVRWTQLIEPSLRESLKIGQDASATRYRNAVEKSIKYRKPKAILIDEGQHLILISAARKLLDQQNTIKSVANRTKTTHILFGNYDLLFLRNLNGQLARRTHDIHFSQYDFGKDEDIQAFKNVLWMFQNHVPVREAPDLVSIWEYLYERSMGCIGILKDWLDRAFKKMLEKDDSVFKFEYLENTVLPMVKCQIIANEIREAEERLFSEGTEFESLKSLLKMNDFHSAKERENTFETKPEKKVRTVGERNPQRDKTGNKTEKKNEKRK